LKKYLELLRITHWVKNTFVLAPLFFSGQFTDFGKLGSGLLAFMAMCFGASAIYILNDLADAENDRLHPIKQQRPIAKKLVSESTAKVIILVLTVLALTLAFYLNLTSGLILVAYIFINILYSFWLKHIPILDIAIIGLGFVLRILLGGEATNILLSHWLVVMTFVLALFLAISKRHDDLLILDKTGTQMRKSLDGYNLKFTSHGMTLLAGTLFLLYFQYLHSAPATFYIGNKASYISSIFVLLGMLRYLQATFVYEKSGSPVSQLLTDRFLQIIVFGWLGHFIFMLYF
jgi:decaprenyl-phosphate phosphoribosyltransferase